MVALSVPLFYVVIENIMQDNVDESLRYEKAWILSQIQNRDPKEFSAYDRNVAVKEVEQILRTGDAYNNKDIYIQNDDEFVNHRVLDFYKEINGRKYHFKIRKSLVENEDILRNIALLQTALFLALLFTLLMINRNVEQKVWKPFYRMLDSLRRYRIDDDNFENPPLSPVSEINDLNTSLADLTERNRKLFNAQKEFTENAAHELQTPLAVIRNKVEMLMQTQPLTEQQIHYIGDIFDTSQKITKLNKSLLLLAKIENNQFETTSDISLRNMLTDITGNFSFVLEEKKLLLQSSYFGDVSITANEQLLQILFGNLMSNAIKYAPENSTIHLMLTQESFEIANPSQYGALDESRLFQRFQKQNTGNESNGLGLEICTKICEQYGWSLQYRYENNQHTFSVHF